MAPCHLRLLLTVPGCVSGFESEMLWAVLETLLSWCHGAGGRASGLPHSPSPAIAGAESEQVLSRSLSLCKGAEGRAPGQSVAWPPAEACLCFCLDLGFVAAGTPAHSPPLTIPPTIMFFSGCCLEKLGIFANLLQIVRFLLHAIIVTCQRAGCRDPRGSYPSAMHAPHSG